MRKRRDAASCVTKGRESAGFDAEASSRAPRTVSYAFRSSRHRLNDVDSRRAYARISRNRAREMGKRGETRATIRDIALSWHKSTDRSRDATDAFTRPSTNLYVARRPVVAVARSTSWKHFRDTDLCGYHDGCHIGFPIPTMATDQARARATSRGGSWRDCVAISWRRMRINISRLIGDDG